MTMQPTTTREKALRTGLGALFVCGMTFLPLAACEKDKGPFEEMGEEIDEAIDEVEDAVDDATDG
ncbi:MAG TPA: hypothetical protein VMT85_14925 [Thermoanaerobaculia bacterium]|nr:hypothetical protein [Thermoanaerobaculia bacterium]